MTDAASAAEPGLVTIVTPCYNGEAYVAEAIESVRAQTYPHIEQIVIDDGSRDGSWEVIRSFGDAVVALRQENQGLCRTRNRAIRRARGEFVLFLDCDDRIAPDTVAALVEAARARPGALAACPWRRLVRRDGAWVLVEPEIPFPQSRPDPLEAWMAGEWIPGCSLLFPREVLRAVGGYDETLTYEEDGDLMYRVFLGGAELVIAAGGESHYRSHGDAGSSMSLDFHVEHRYRSRMRVLEKLAEGLRSTGRWERYRVPLGTAYLRLAELGFASNPELARECLRRGEALAGKRSVSRTLPGRLLVRLLGMERKEQLATALARWGVMTAERRRIVPPAPPSHPAPEPPAPGA